MDTRLPRRLSVPLLLLLAAGPAWAQGSYDANAFDLAGQMLGRGATVDTLLVRLARQYRQTPPQITAILVDHRVSPRTFVPDLAKQFRAAPSDLAQWLRATPADPGTVLTGLLTVASSDAAGLAAMQNGGYSAAESLQALIRSKIISTADPDDTLPFDVMVKAGYEALDAMTAWVEVVESSPAFAASQLRRSGEGADAVGALLADHLGLTPWQVREALIGAGYPAEEVLAVVITLLQESGVWSGEYARLLEGFDCDVIEAAWRGTDAWASDADLVIHGSPMECRCQVGASLLNGVSPTLDVLVVVLLALRSVPEYSAADCGCGAVSDVNPTQFTPGQLAEILNHRGVPDDEAALLLQCIFGSDLEVLIGMREGYDWTPGDAVGWLGCGSFGDGSNWPLLNEAGYSDAEVVHGLRVAVCDPVDVLRFIYAKEPAMSMPEALALMAEAGYPPDEVAAAQIEFSDQSIATFFNDLVAALIAAFGMTVEAATALVLSLSPGA